MTIPAAAASAASVARWEAGVMDVSEGWPIQWPDDRFWVRLGRMTPDVNLRWRIEGNAHTHRGRFHVCAIGHDEHRSVNLADVAEASAEAWVWLDGFLRGQEPDLVEYLGESVDLLESADDDDVRRWRGWLARFREVGFEPSELGVMPTPVPHLNGVVDPPPWVYVADLYRCWRDGSWTVADPQPAPANLDGKQGWAWPGTVCDERGHHAIGEVDGLSICEDCHLLVA